ncbi:hypothetical protein OKA04_14600 [Luteolibacter flavescens]|uniref:Uncharacterized protein n=1 Tax=Luteolibacter flavescens TaxID=1859460 RepID=A0ABT3FRV9_9BACT|nr:hypothetical protein [Luteolibacter flavescens]MCW1885966.1 hypothetical protein [Luteolibacter flavescens]
MTSPDGVSPGAMNCPHCQRLLYSRQHARCGHCGGILPDGVRFSDHEIDEMKAEIHEIDARRAVAKEQEDEEREERRRRARQQHGINPYFTGM